MFGALCQVVKLRLVDGTTDEQPHLETQNSTIQLVLELVDLMITALSWKADFRIPKSQAVAVEYSHIIRENTAQNTFEHMLGAARWCQEIQ